MSKRSQSQVITIVLLFLLVIGGIVILWNVYLSIIKDFDERYGAPEVLAVDLKIEDINISGNTIKISRGVGDGDLSGLRFVFYDTNGNTHIGDLNSNLPVKLETKTYLISNIVNGSFVVEKVGLAAILDGNIGLEKIRSVGGVSFTSFPTQGLISHWEFEGDFDDCSTCVGNNGVAVGGAYTGNDVLKGNVLILDGVDDRVTVADDDSLDFGINSFSVGGWLYVNSSNGNVHWEGIVRKHNVIGIYAPGLIGYGLGTTGGSSNITTKNPSAVIGNGSNIINKNGPTFGTTGTNQWQHYFFVVDRNSQELKLYINGVLDGSGVDISSVGSVSNSNILEIGKDLNYWTGKIDDVMIYNRNLADTEVNDIYNSQKP